jgi:hypothetical protein
MILFIEKNKYLVRFRGPLQATFETDRVPESVLRQIHQFVKEGDKAQHGLSAAQIVFVLLLLLQVVWFLVASSMMPHFFRLSAFSVLAVIWYAYRVVKAEKKVKKLAAENNVLLTTKEYKLANLLIP